MKYALIADIHANLEALEAVLSEIDKSDAERIVCLGDIVGYHADPSACIARLREVDALCIAGNHDRVAAGLQAPRRFGAKARHAITWTRKQISKEDKKFLRDLPVWLDLGDFEVVHGALHPEPNVDLHLSTPERAKASLEALALRRGAATCFFGHTHRPVAYALHHGQLETIAPLEALTSFRDCTYLINPGSVGQPRDGDERAAFATYHANERTLRIHRVEYDRQTCLAKCAAAGLLDPPRPTALSRLRERVDEHVDLWSQRVRRVRRALVPTPQH